MPPIDHLEQLGDLFASTAPSERKRMLVIVNPPRLEVEVDGTPLDAGVSVFVQNGDPYTYFRTTPIHVADHSRLDSGHLAGALLTRARFTDMPSIAWRAFSAKRQVTDAKAARGFHDVTEVVARSAGDDPIPLQVDGDYIGDVMEARFSVAPGKLCVVA